MLLPQVAEAKADRQKNSGLNFIPGLTSYSDTLVSV